MKKELIIELMLYVAILIIAVVMLFEYKPVEKRIQVPKDFKEDNSYFRKDESLKSHN